MSPREPVKRSREVEISAFQLDLSDFASSLVSSRLVAPFIFYLLPRFAHGRSSREPVERGSPPPPTSLSALADVMDIDIPRNPSFIPIPTWGCLWYFLSVQQPSGHNSWLKEQPPSHQHAGLQILLNYLMKFNAILPM